MLKKIRDEANNRLLLERLGDNLFQAARPGSCA